MFNNRPRIELKKTRTDKIIEIVGWCILVVMWCSVFIYYSKMPDIIPIHYNSVGQVDDYGDKSMMWSLLIIGSVMYIGLVLLNKIPYIFNYSTKITTENAFSQYTNATKIIRYLNLIIISTFSFIVFKTILISLT